jgi:ubiquinone biosynthesis protein UbiJ
MSLRPEDVPAEARRRAAAAGDAPEGELDVTRHDPSERLPRWAFIDVDTEEIVRSTRPLGRPITGFKRMLARLMRQYHAEQNSQITRFNLQLLAYVEQLERRVAELEARLGEPKR